MKLRLAGPPQLIDLSQDRGALRHRAQGPLAHHRRDDAACRGRDLAGRAGGDPGARRSRRHDRRSGGAPHAARSAARSPTTIRTPTIRRPASGSAPPSSPTSAASRPTISSTACSRPRSSRTRSSPRSASRCRRRRPTQKFRNPASRYALVGVFVVQARQRDPRRGDRRRRQRRVPRPVVRGGAEEALRAEIARRA